MDILTLKRSISIFINQKLLRYVRKKFRLDVFPEASKELRKRWYVQWIEKKLKSLFLTKHELEVIASKNFKWDRLRNVRDLFLFNCYTGLACADVKKLCKDEVAIGGRWWAVDHDPQAKDWHSIQGAFVTKITENHWQVPSSPNDHNVRHDLSDFDQSKDECVFKIFDKYR